MPTPSPEWLEHQIVAGSPDAILYAERDGIIGEVEIVRRL